MATRGAGADEGGGSSAVKGNTVAAVEQAVCMGVHNLRALTRVSLRPIPQWAALEGVPDRRSVFFWLFDSVVWHPRNIQVRDDHFHVVSIKHTFVLTI